MMKQLMYATMVIVYMEGKTQDVYRLEIGPMTCQLVEDVRYFKCNALVI